MVLPAHPPAYITCLIVPQVSPPASSDPSDEHYQVSSATAYALRLVLSAHVYHPTLCSVLTYMTSCSAQGSRTMQCAVLTHTKLCTARHTPRDARPVRYLLSAHYYALSGTDVVLIWRY